MIRGVTSPPLPPASDDSPPGHEWLFEFLRERDVPCPLCGYNLRALHSNCCPECGRELRLNIGLAESYVKAWVAALVTMGASAGVGLFVLMVVLKEGWPPPRLRLLSVSLAYFILSIPGFGILLVTRRRYLRLPRGIQRRIAMACVTLSLLGLVAFFMGLER